MEEKLEIGGKDLPANDHIGSEGSKNVILAVVVEDGHEIHGKYCILNCV